MVAVSLHMDTVRGRRRLVVPVGFRLNGVVVVRGFNFSLLLLLLLHRLQNWLLRGIA